METLEDLAAHCGTDNIIVTGKTAQFARLLATCKRALTRLPAPTPAGRDAVQALLANLHFGDLVDALEVMFVERCKVEEVLSRCSPLESIGDVVVFEQYLVGLQHTNAMAKDEIARLTMDRQPDGIGGIDGIDDINAVHAVHTVQGQDAGVETESGELDKSAALNERLIKELKTAKESLQAEQERHKEELQTIKKELHAVTQKATLLREEVNKCERREEDRLEEIKYLQAELERAQRDGDEREAELREPLEAQITDLSKQLDNANSMVNQYKQDAIVLQGKLADCEGKVGEFKATITNLQSEVSHLKTAASNTTTYEREIESLKKTNKAAMDELLLVREHLSTAKRAIISQEYLRNVVVSFLCTPGQRPHMLQVLSELLQMTPEQVSKVNLS